MSRRLVLLAVVAALAACGDEPPVRRSRVEGAAAAAPTPDPSRFWDRRWTAAEAPLFALPAVAPARPGTTVAAPAADRWLWVNVWATWCGPCRREMPLILTLAERLRADGVPVDLCFLSLDEDPTVLARFLAENPAAAPGDSVRAVSAAEATAWLAGLTGADASSIPINLVAAPGRRLAAARVGSIRAGDYPAVRDAFRAAP